ncbi:acetyltransferase [Sphingomonas sp. Leaf357]|uniref:GNAT family N-acetyltransferase n=1 Tax=Sphingomonas sp. Leaf357 TaxID=1736350 RepID=UPI0006FD9964|nr:GNAT family N-acetyltransferase [Sphingomonas sp. Leaf357]KQS01546.1 acetyltransferase [Sphingomonas sp. Leaf357]
MRIARDDLSHPAVIALLDYHLAQALENSPPGAVFALDHNGLRAPDVTVWSAWEGETLLALGAMKELDAAHGELKSMRTAPDQLRRGAGGMMLGYLIAEARARGYARLSLETGSNAAFAAARAMYERAGFETCGPFAGYSDTGFSRYYTLGLG